MRKYLIRSNLRAHFMFSVQMFQKNHTLHILPQKPSKPLEYPRMHEDDFVLHVPSDSSEISLYQIQSTKLVHKGELQNEALINTANHSVEFGARIFKEELWDQAERDQADKKQYTFCTTVTPRSHLSMTPIELKTLMEACRLPAIAEELSELNCKLSVKQTSPSNVDFERSPVNLIKTEQEKQEDAGEFDFASAHGGRY
jgi:hypothetical protein